MELFDLMQKMNAVHGPSGDEGGIRAVIEELARPYADEITTDTLGNLIVRKKGNGPKVMFAAHMDSIGFIVTYIEKEGFLRVGAVGGITPHDVAFTPVRFKNGTRGVLVPEEKAEDFGKLKLDQCYLDIGAKSAEEAQKLIQVGDTAVYDTAVVSLGDKVISPYMDNRVACAMLLCALEQMPAQCPNDVYFVFTVQEEVGIRGAKVASYAIDPDFGVAVDVTDVNDTPGSEKGGTCQLGKGAGVKVMDLSVICHPQVVSKMDALAQEKGITVQRDIMRVGGTDAGAIHLSRMGVRTGGISVPCRYVHTPVEMVDKGDFDACVALTVAYATADLT